MPEVWSVVRRAVTRSARAPALAVLVVAGQLALPVSARGQHRRAELLPRRDALAGRVSLGLENDNLLFGLWRLIGEDGDDTGRTHALDLELALTRPDGVTFGLEVESTLFLTDFGRPRRLADADGNFFYRDDEGQGGYLVDDVFVRLDGTVVPRDALEKVGPRTYVDGAGAAVFYRPRTFVRDGREVELDLNSARRVPQRKDLPVEVHELTFLRLSVDTRAAPEGFWWRATFGPVIGNGRRVTAGATGQQRVWHALIDWREYDYQASDRANAYGVAAGGYVGHDARLAELGSARLSLELAVGAEFATLAEGSRAFGSAAVTLEAGAAHAPWGELRLAQELHAWAVLVEATAVTRVYGAVHPGPVTVFLRLNLYSGGLANGWFVYNRNRPTTDGGLEVRF